ncbi:MAG: hypothetical protein HDQ88_01790 [Clostridia bacterium]|nr:hypothetical protein [Clostridia bacterium]
MKAIVKSTGEIIKVETIQPAIYRDIKTSGIDERIYYHSELEFLSDTPEKVTLEGWVARDKEFEEDFFSSDIFLYKEKPIRNENFGVWEHGVYDFVIPHDSFSSVTWETEPKKVRIAITPIEE